MNWPLPQDINEAVQNPASAFADPDLQGGSVDVGPLGVPLPRSGGFADVYRIHGADGRDWAVKCFTRPVPGLQDRYAAIDHYLAQAALPFAVGFSYLPEGLRVRGGEYPIVKMPWVEGFPLNEFVSDNLTRLNVLESLLTVWGRLTRRLRESGLAHADLQHGNVIMVPGTSKSLLGVRLVDYDGMYVPALAGRPPAEVGHPSYQHPDRAAKNIYTGDLDRFPHLVISTALRGLIVGGQKLWDKYDTGDNILFTEKDFKSPEKSKVMRELWDTGDPGTVALLSHLAIACKRPIDQAAWLDLVMPEGKPATVTPNQEREAAVILGVPVSVSVATTNTGSSGTMPRMQSGTIPPVAARLPTAASSQVMQVAPRVAVAAPVAAPAPIAFVAPEPQLKFGEDLRAGSRGGKRSRSKSGLFVLAGIVLLAGAGGAAYFLQPFGTSVAVTTEPEKTPPPTSTDAPPVKPPDVPVSVPVVLTPEVTAKRVWSVKAEELKGNAEPRHARFTADGKAVVVGASGNPGLGLVLSAETGRTITKFTGHDHPCIASPGPEGKAYSLGQGEPKVLVWSALDAKPADSIRLPEGTPGDYSRMTLTADGNRAQLDNARQARIVDFTTDKDVTPLPNLIPGQICLERDTGRILTMISRDKQLVIWNTDGTEAAKVPLTAVASQLEAWSPDGRFAVLLGFPIGTPSRQILTVVDASTGQPVKSLETGYATGTVRFSADGSHLVAVTKAGPVEVWRTTDWVLVASIPSSATPYADLSPSGTKVVLTGPGNSVRLFDLGGAEVAFTPGQGRKGSLAELWRVDPAADPKTDTLKFSGVSTDGKTLYAVVATTVGTASDAETFAILKGFDSAFGEQKFSVRIGKSTLLPSSVVPTTSGRVVVYFPSPATGSTPIAVLDGRTGELARPTATLDRRFASEPRATDTDAKFFAGVYDADGPTIGVWDLETGTQLATLAPKGKQTPRSLGFVPTETGLTLMVAYSDRLARYSGTSFDVETVLNDKITIKNGLGLGVTSDISRLVLSHHSQGTASYTYSTLDLKTAAHRDLLRDRKSINAQLLNTDQLFVADESAITLTDVATAKVVSQTAFPKKVAHVTASADGTLIAAVDGTSLVAYRGYLDVAPPTLPKTEGRFDLVWLKKSSELGNTPYRAIAVGPGGRAYAAIGPRLLSFAPTGPLTTIRPTAPLEYLSMTPDGSMYVAERTTEEEAPRFRPLDPKSGKPTADGFELSKSPASGIAYDLSPDSRTALAFSAKTVTVWATATGKKLWSKEPEVDGGQFLSAAFLDNAKILIAVRSDHDEIVVIDIANQRPDRSIPLADAVAGLIADTDPVFGVALIRYPENVEAGANAIDLKTGKVLYPSLKVNGKIAPQFAAGGRLILAAVGDKLVIFNARTGRELARDTLPGPIDDFAVTPDGTYAAVLYGTTDSGVRTELALLKLSDTSAPDEPKVVERLVVPDEATVAAALLAIKEANKVRFATTSVAGKKALVEYLLKGANLTKTEAPTRFVMFKEALRIATELRDYSQVDAIGEQIGRAFALDEFDLKADALGRIAESFTVAAPARSFADVCEEQAERAAEKQNYDSAIKLLGAASRALKQVTATKSMAMVADQIAYFKRAKARSLLAKDALEPLRVKPDDPEPNLAVGSFRCVYLGKWEDGIKFLAKGSDPNLRSAAVKELAAAPGEGEYELAEVWADAASKATADDRIAYTARARYWYTKAAAGGVPVIVPKAEAKLAFTRNSIEYKPALVLEGVGVNNKGAKVTPGKGMLVPVVDFNGSELTFDKDKATGLQVRWTGVLFPPRPGRYKLILQSTDPAALQIEKLVVAEITKEAGRDPKLVGKEAGVLLPDRPVAIQIDWNGNLNRRHQLRLSWVTPGGVEELIPAECLIHEKRQELLIPK